MILFMDCFKFSVAQTLIASNKTRIAALSALLCAGTLLSVSSIADDTDIFFADDVDSVDSVANVMFMFDTSGSMDYTEVGGDPRPTTPREDTRMYRLKNAMVQVLESVENVNVGIGAFNGRQVGGSIRFPVIGVDEDLCVDAECETVSLLTKIDSNEDDAQQTASGAVELYNDYLLPDEASDLATPSGASLMALRFTDLNIPRGAEITRAQLRMVSPETGDRNAEFRVFAEKTGDSQPFTGYSGELTDRYDNRSNEFEDWERGDWEDKDKPGLSPDLQSIVQEITSDDDWCGGNALTMLLTGVNNKRVYTHDHDKWLAPILEVDYNPASIVVEDTCLRTTVTSSIVDGSDDVSVDLPTGDATADADTLYTRNNDDLQRLGLRFDSVDVPAGASISSAYIELTSKGSTDGDVTLTIQAETSASAEPIDGSLAYPFSSTSRSFSGPAVEWDVPDVESGVAQQSPDIGSLVENVVNTSGWSDGSSMLFTLNQSAGTGTRSFAAADSATLAARLIIKYQQDGDDLDDALPVLMTGREQLINSMLVLRPDGTTPFLDYFYEASQYMLGRNVDFGLQRGDQRGGDRYHRVSVASSYEPESIITEPDGCTELNPLALACKDEVIEGNPTYIAPAMGECNSNHIILLSDGQPTRNSAKTRVETLIGGSCERTVADGVSENRDYNKCAVELAEWLANSEDSEYYSPDRESVVTNTIGMNITSQLLIDIASKGDGQFYPVSSAADISGAFSAIIQSAISQESSFVAPSTSVSLQNRLVNSNDVYFAMFNPDTSTRWDGNLKRYSFAADASGELQIVDSQDTAILDDDGVILDSARSFWSDVDDGSTVNLGGAASQQTLTRNLYVSLQDTNTTDTETVLQEFSENNDQITNNHLGITGATDEYRTSLLQWARGVDIKDYDGDGDYAEVRPQMGDPLHSTQQIFSYPGDTETDDPQSLIFVGTNEGFLHAIDVEDGSEEFAFIPGDLLSNLDYYYRDNPVDNNSRPYGLDGEITGWHNDENNNGIVDGSDTAYLYVGMRRGGRNYYALDVTDPSDPDLLWTIEGGAEGDFAELGQTWSRPVKTKVNYRGTEKDVLFFAGGYDPVNDYEVSRSDAESADSYGAALFMVDASTGEKITSRDVNDFSAMIYSIPSDLRVINPDGDDYSNSIFVGDTGGQLWRFDINNAATSDNDFLTGTVLADFGGLATVDNRQFFHEPDVAVISSVPGASFLNIAIGSGTRPDPNSLIVENGFYSIRDSSIYGAPLDADGAIEYAATLGESDLVNVTNTSGSADTSGNISNGWYFRMPFSGEKVLSTALTVDNNLYFTSYSPITEVEDICAPQIGAGYVYSLDVAYGDPISGDTDLTDRYTQLTAPGIPSRVIGLIVEAAPNTVSKFVGLEGLDQDTDSAPFDKSFWAEQ